MTVIYSDSFDGPDGEPLDGRVTTGGGAWELFGNTSRLELTGTGGLTRAFQSTNGAAVLDAGTTDHYVKFEGVDRDSDHYLVCCFVDLDNHVQLRLVSGGGWQLDTEVGGVNRNVATVDVAANMLATGNVLTLVRDPVAKTVGFTLNGTEYGPFTVGDAVFDTATKVGFWGRRPVATMATAIEVGANDDGGPPVPDPFGGDDIVICAGPIVEPPRDYCLRSDNGERLAAALAKAGLRRRKAMRPADVVQLLVAAGQHHLGIATPTGLVHADFSVGRVVESTIPADWRLLSAWRLTIDEEI
ncbi:MAG: hypothetical protein AAF205_13610 [Pseudomonadota bacterium]